MLEDSPDRNADSNVCGAIFDYTGWKAKTSTRRGCGRKKCFSMERSPKKGNYLLCSSSLVIASTRGFKISRVTACKTSGFIFASTFATISSMSGAEAGAGLLEMGVAHAAD